MAIETKWLVSQLDTAPSEDGLTDVVKTVHYRYQGQDAEYFAEVYGTMGCETPSDTDFTAYEDLTYEQVCLWLIAGLDGLATGASIMTFLAFVLIGVWEFGQSCALNDVPGCYAVRDPLDLAVLAAAFAGGCTGFLWWNTAPAKIFMGDTGSLALGGAIAGLAATLRVELLLIPLGGLFVIITMSVLIQTVYFKISGGKRVFKMAPLHHHFELIGWEQITIVIRFWIIAGLCVSAGLGLFYAQWVAK